MDKIKLPGIGMRKIKSLLAVALAFALWQLVRIPFPEFHIHPLFGYMYAVIEMRDSVAKTRQFGKLRIKATLLGLGVGLSALPLSMRWGVYAGQGAAFVLADLVIILLGILVTLWLAELMRCETFCGIAAIIFIICLVRDRDTNVNLYLYAILRVFQTLLGVFCAWVVNACVCPYPKQEGAQGAPVVNGEECSMLRKTDLSQLKDNVFSLIGDAWMLVTAGGADGCNTMTASWGGLGVLWGEPAATIYVRPQRYTKEFIDREEYFTLSFFDPEYKPQLALCGSKSGRDVDKVKECGFTVAQGEGGAPYFEQARLVLVCRKQYAQEMDPAAMPDHVKEKWYPQSDFHTMYIGQIVEVYTKD